MAEEKKGVVTEFKEFVLRGNVVDLAVAVVIGAAFTAVVTSFVANIITPLIAAIFGKPDFKELTFTINKSQFFYGSFLNAVISFLAIAFVVFFFVVKPLNYMTRAAPQGPRRRRHRRAPVPGVQELHPQGGHALRLLHLAGAAGRRLITVSPMT